jgi:hypothetical protein
VLPVHGDGVNTLPEHLKTTPPEPIVWTFEEATGKNIVEGEDPGPGPMAAALQHCLRQAGTGKTVVFPDADEFESAIPQSHRKGEKAYHVKGHRGSKEGNPHPPPSSLPPLPPNRNLYTNICKGYLFFTSIGILWAFKKPLAFFDFSSITSVSYTAVLRNTFNLVITTQTGDIEFGMLDQADYTGINEYVQKHGLQDASLAAARRAKKENVEKAANGTATGDGGGDGLTELQKAEQELEDLEDEEEEDYEPGNESESDGSGEDSEDDEGGEEYEEGYEEGEDEEMGGQE